MTAVALYTSTCMVLVSIYSPGLTAFKNLVLDECRFPELIVIWLLSDACRSSTRHISWTTDRVIPLQDVNDAFSAHTDALK